MPENKHSTSIDWVSIDQLDAVLDPDNPELTQADFARGQWRRGGRPTGNPVGRPTLSGGKDLVSIRIDRAVLTEFRQSGPGWQGRINEILRKAVGL